MQRDGRNNGLVLRAMPTCASFCAKLFAAACRDYAFCGAVANLGGFQSWCALPRSAGTDPPIISATRSIILRQASRNGRHPRFSRKAHHILLGAPLLHLKLAIGTAVRVTTTIDHS
jgi:hypothetical protein